jgi:DNA modification methylase
MQIDVSLRATCRSGNLWQVNPDTNIFKLAQESLVRSSAVLDAAERSSDVGVDTEALSEIEALNQRHERQWAKKISVANELTRAMVSFQANKSRAIYRWFKYKEAFSAGLVEHFLSRYHLSSGVLLDPFAGSGTALFAAGGMGMKAVGIELLPIGQRIIETKTLIDWQLSAEDVESLSRWAAKKPWQQCRESQRINELRITTGAYPRATIEAMGKYLARVGREREVVRTILLFALLCVLESVSYTRKDGQYLRWDYRSGRRQGKKVFDKGEILAFNEAITAKLEEIVTDLKSASQPDDLFFTTRSQADIVLHKGSCLEILPAMRSDNFDCILTSPPYCNRYDYTRTYALELALLGVDEEALVKLRQAMVSCTVENREKDLLAMNPNWQRAIAVAATQPLLQRILSYLETQRQRDLLNNNGIPRMVRGYFYEMACVIAECSRVLKRGAPLIMVNDNVRYAGASISVDIILSEMAQQLGFVAENILVLPNGKGNSSQQMGAHGRDPLRKCVYVWRKK